MSVSNKKLGSAFKQRQSVVRILPILALCCQWLFLYFHYRRSYYYRYGDISFLSFLGFGKGFDGLFYNPGGVSGNLSAFSVMLVAFSPYILLIVFSFIKRIRKGLFAVPAALFVVLYVPIIGEKVYHAYEYDSIESLLRWIVRKLGYGQPMFIHRFRTLMERNYCFYGSFSTWWLFAGILIIVVLALAMSALLSQKREVFLLSVIVGIICEVVILTESFTKNIDIYTDDFRAVVFQVLVMSLFAGSYIVKAGYATVGGTLKAIERTPSSLPTKFCPTCGTRFAMEKSFCDKCGGSLKEVIGDGSIRIALPLFCAKCGIGFEEGKKFCDRCGGELTEKAANNV